MRSVSTLLNFCLSVCIFQSLKFIVLNHKILVTYTRSLISKCHLCSENLGPGFYFIDCNFFVISKKVGRFRVLLNH